jgi:hypothetical protein
MLQLVRVFLASLLMIPVFQSKHTFSDINTHYWNASGCLLTHIRMWSILKFEKQTKPSAVAR